MSAASIAIIMPWEGLEGDERRLRTSLKWTFIVFLIFAIVIPILQVPELERKLAKEIPPRFAKLIIERKQPPPIAEVVPEPQAVKEKAKQPVETTPVKPSKKPVKKARQAGLLAFKDTLKELRSYSFNTSVKVPAPKAAKKLGKSERSVIASKVSESSRGINVAKLSKDTGGVALAGHSTKRVESKIDNVSRAKRPASTHRTASRTDEEIQLIFDRHKSSLYTLYRRALRRDPSLQGKVILRLTIAPSGKVTNCDILSSELHAPELERKITQRVKLFEFGSKDVSPVTINFPIDFLPA